MQETRKNTSVLDVGEYVLGRLGPLDGWQLQKLVYYCQAWSLVWKNKPLFREQLQAWVHGPVVSELYQMHTGQTSILTVGGHTEHLSAVDRATIDEVLHYYGDMSGKDLRDQTHAERPWRDARGALPENMPSSEPIQQDALQAFYAKMPCGPTQLQPDMSAFSPERVARSREQLRSGDWCTLDQLEDVNAASR